MDSNHYLSVLETDMFPITPRTYYGGAIQNWTENQLLTRQLLYQLSYNTIMECLMRFELILSVWKTDMLTINITGTYNERHH